MDLEAQIRARRTEQANQLVKSFSSDIIVKGGKLGQEGEIREYANGKKYKKTGGKWVEVTGDKKDKKEDPKGNQQASQQGAESSVDKHEIAQLTHLKSVLKDDPGKAYEIYEGLSPEAQDAVPQDIVNQMVKTSHESSKEGSAASKIFDDDEEDEAQQAIRRNIGKESGDQLPDKKEDEKSKGDTGKYSAESIDSLYKLEEQIKPIVKISSIDDLDQHTDKITKEAKQYIQAHKQFLDKQIPKEIENTKAQLKDREALVERTREDYVKDIENDVEKHALNIVAGYNTITGSVLAGMVDYSGMEGKYAQKRGAVVKKMNKVVNTLIKEGVLQKHTVGGRGWTSASGAVPTMKSSEAAGSGKEGSSEDLAKTVKDLEKKADRLAGSTASSAKTKAKLQEVGKQLGEAKKKLAAQNKGKDIKKAFNTLGILSKQDKIDEQFKILGL